jgi:hypothetical protein
MSESPDFRSPTKLGLGLGITSPRTPEREVSAQFSPRTSPAALIWQQSPRIQISRENSEQPIGIDDVVPYSSRENLGLFSLGNSGTLESLGFGVSAGSMSPRRTPRRLFDEEFEVSVFFFSAFLFFSSSLFFSSLLSSHVYSFSYRYHYTI